MTDEMRLAPLTRLLRWMAVVSAILWIVSLVYIAVDWSQGNGFPLLRKFFPFEDITIYQSRFQLYHSPAFYQGVTHMRRQFGSPVAFAYPPAAALIYAVFYVFPSPQVIYVLLLATWVVLIVGGVWSLLVRYLPSRGLAARYLACLTASSFPLVFLAERGNIELLVWIALTGAVWLCLRGQRTAPAALIGCAAAVKLYPIFLLGLFFSRRRNDWRAVGAGVLAGVLATFAAVWYSGPTFFGALDGFVNGVAKFNHQHAEAPRRSEAVFDHSLFSPVKVAYLGTHDSPQQWTTLYFVIAGLIALAAFWFVVRRLPFLNRLAFLSVAMVVLPPVSYDYTIVHLYLPLLLILVAAVTQLRSATNVHPSMLRAVGCLLFAMLPLGLLQGGTFLYAGEVQLLALLLLAFLATRSGWVLPFRSAVPE